MIENPLMPAKQKTKIDGNKIFDVSELFRCYVDLYSMFYRRFSISTIFSYRCFVVLFFVIDPLKTNAEKKHKIFV